VCCAVLIGFPICQGNNGLRNQGASAVFHRALDTGIKLRESYSTQNQNKESARQDAKQTQSIHMNLHTDQKVAALRYAYDKRGSETKEPISAESWVLEVTASPKVWPRSTIDTAPEFYRWILH
jgi:hypothetical protein